MGDPSALLPSVQRANSGRPFPGPKAALDLPPNGLTTQTGGARRDPGAIRMRAAMTFDRYLMAALSGLVVGTVLLLGALVVREVEVSGKASADTSVIGLRGAVQ